MKHIICIVTFVCLELFVFSGAQASIVPSTNHKRDLLADSIMQKVISHAPFYEHAIGEYYAGLYIKGKVNLRKKNHLIRFIPTMFHIKKGVREYLMETYSDLHFTAPNIYDQKVKANMGTSSEFWTLDGRLPDYFHINIYSSSLLCDKLLSPLAKNAPGYYTYHLDSVMGEAPNQEYKIRFIPKNKSFQLVKGYMIVSDNAWSVRRIRFFGRSDILRAHIFMDMGKVGEPDEFLPVHYDADVTFRFLGNVIDCNYTAALKYEKIEQKASLLLKEKGNQSKYDLSDSYLLSCDSNACINDSAYLASLRPIPLSLHDQDLYREFFLRQDTLLQYKKKRKLEHKALEFWGELGDALISRYRVDLSKMGSVRCSPLINPFLLSYGGSNGLAYRQEFKYNCLFPGDRLLRIVPKVGYNFKRKEFYWSVNSDFDYWPQKRAAFHVSIGNGNRIYSSDVLDELKSIPDSLFNFDQIHLDYFNDLYFKLDHSWEIVNGLSLDLGVSIHKRSEVKRSNFASVNSSTDPDAVSDLMPKLRHTYSSFAPHVSLSWTPGQYYYMSGKRKVNLYSKYPTFAVDWERGINGVFNSTGRYERVECDIQQNISLGLMRALYLRFGWGAFTNQKEMYFVDFANFSRSNLPVGWNDEIGGVFQLLDGRWYNSSRKYVRGHVVYESPFFLISHLKKYTQSVLNERLYLNALVVPHLKPYIEAGYGIGTSVFDFGAFVSFSNWKYREIGCKFTFELFNR